MLIQHSQDVLSEKLYHEILNYEVEDSLVEKWMKGLLDDITFQVEKIQSRE
jgi:hypothetical protein